MTGLLNTLRSFLGFCQREGFLELVPLQNVKSPTIREDPIQPFSHEQIQSLLDAVRRGRNPERDRAIILVLLDSGLRVSELCSLTVGDVDHAMGTMTVTGKGNKRRAVYLGAACRRALWRYLETERGDAPPHEPLLISQLGGGLAAGGVQDLLRRLETSAGISGVRCSPHTLRHTFAINFLRNGGNVLELQRLLGHESLDMTRRYVALADVDLSRAHRQASPADRMNLR